MKRWVAIGLVGVAGLAGCGDPILPAQSGEDSGSPRVTPPPSEDSGAGGGVVPPPPASNDAGSPAVDASSPPDAGPPPPPAAYLTTDDLSQALASVPLTMGDSGNADAVVTVDPATAYQSVVGFGASITDSSSYVMTKYLSASALTDTLEKLFDASKGVGLSFLRQPMGASDFSSVGNFSYDDGSSDPSLASFSIAQDMKATIPVLKQALAINEGITILGTPWSPPAWMKNNNSMDGSGGAPGNSGLATPAYGPLGDYFVKFVQAYAAQGVTVTAVTPQNEPLNGSANYPGMDLSATAETQLVGQDMGPAITKAGLSTQIWAYDHNWDVESYPEQVIGDSVAGPFTEGAAFHCYGGDVSAMSTFHQNFPGKSVYMTECSGGGWQGDAFANTIDLVIGSMANWARAIALWNMALDENAGPQNNGCPDCRGVITVDSQSGNVTYNADYYALGHFSKFVFPGAVRVSSKSANGAFSQVAFKNTNGSLAVIGHNTGGSTLTVQVGSGDSAMSVQVPANAGITFAWTPGVN